MEIDWHTIETNHPVLAAMPRTLQAAARLRPFKKGQALFHQGERPANMLFVLSGEVRLVRRTFAGSEMILQRGSTGFIAEASLDTSTYHCDIVAASDGQLLLFPRSRFKTALAQDAAFNQTWIDLLAAEVRRLRARCERLSLNSAADRVLHYLEAESKDGVVTLTQTRKAWAAELGLSHEVLYRTLRSLREVGTIQIDGNRIALQSSLHRTPRKSHH
ncbi:MAG: Crp/Fnr family transcriptional regulator [Gammaproteobacteria bacterium]